MDAALKEKEAELKKRDERITELENHIMELTGIQEPGQKEKGAEHGNCDKNKT